MVTLFNEMQDLLAYCKSTRASVNRLNACTCTKGEGLTRKQRRFCDFCQALSGFGVMRRKIEALKEKFREQKTASQDSSETG